MGPFVDDTDFKTAETGLTIANTDIKLMVNGAASVNKNSGGGTHRVNGFYGVTFDATDTATVGEMVASVAVAGALPVFATFYVVEEAVFDMLFAGSAAGYNPVQAWTSLAISGAMTVGGGVAITQSSSNSPGMSLTGNGTGAGLSITSGSGATGDALLVTAASTNGRGINAAGAGTGAGLRAVGGATGNGVSAVGGSTSGDAILTSATSGHGATFAGSGTSKHGINAVGGATTGAGFAATGGSTSGDGMLVSGPTLGHGINATGAGTGKVAMQAGNISDGIILGSAATGTLSTTQATTTLTGYANSQLVGRYVLWLSGSVAGEASQITAYASSGGLLTFNALTTAPANGNLFKIV
jgi:hypothetical protein